MFDLLPTELVERILAFLSYEEKVAVLEVCRRSFLWYVIKSMSLCHQVGNNIAKRDRTAKNRCRCPG